MQTLLFGAGHQTEKARQKRKNSQKVRKYGGYTTYPTSSAASAFFSNAKINTNLDRSSTFPSYFTNQTTASASTSANSSPTSPTANAFLSGTDTFRKSPEPETSPTSPTGHKRKADELEQANPEHEKLRLMAAKPKRRLSIDPGKKLEDIAHNKHIQEARKKCEELGLQYKND